MYYKQISRYIWFLVCMICLYIFLTIFNFLIKIWTSQNANEMHPFHAWVVFTTSQLFILGFSHVVVFVLYYMRMSNKVTSGIISKIVYFDSSLIESLQNFLNGCNSLWIIPLRTVWTCMRSVFFGSLHCNHGNKKFSFNIQLDFDKFQHKQ